MRCWRMAKTRRKEGSRRDVRMRARKGEKEKRRNKERRKRRWLGRLGD